MDTNERNERVEGVLDGLRDGWHGLPELRLVGQLVYDWISGFEAEELAEQAVAMCRSLRDAADQVEGLLNEALAPPGCRRACHPPPSGSTQAAGPGSLP